MIRSNQIDRLNRITDQLIIRSIDEMSTDSGAGLLHLGHHLGERDGLGRGRRRHLLHLRLVTLHQHLLQRRLACSA